MIESLKIEDELKNLLNADAYKKLIKEKEKKS